ncbi:hypothetical protein AB9E28_35865, partial [Rhizobium leguminosarum]|uniref:hypothetical protein n=1 Tax=Rhizobium leguminosarum TaxID=384 RepID=UPI003F96E0FB
DLEITCVPDAACLARWFALPEVMGALATPMGVPAVGKLVEIFGALLAIHPTKQAGEFSRLDVGLAGRSDGRF